nr:HAMP domain-containing sensor histidine kinase [uncultured Carboxylicivirga sp.]
MAFNYLAKQFYLNDIENDIDVLDKYYDSLPEQILKYYKVLLPFMLLVFITYCFTDHLIREIPALSVTRIPAIVMILALLIIKHSPLKDRKTLVVVCNNIYVLGLLSMGLGIISITAKNNMINPGITAFIMLTVGSYFFIKGFYSILLVYTIPLLVTIFAIFFYPSIFANKQIEFINPMVIYIGVIAVSLLSEKTRFNEFYYKTKLSEEKHRTDNLYKEVVHQNIELVSLDKSRNEALSELTVSNNTKDKLFSLIAHDLRQPFSVLIGLSKVLVEERKLLSEDDLNEFHKQIYIASESTYKLLENLLQWSMSQTNSFIMNPSSQPINKLINEVINEVQPALEQKQIIIKKQLINADVWIDKDAFMAITRNILTNAIKFSKSKERIEISTLPKDELINISFKDYGAGITPETLTKITNSMLVESQPGTNNEKGTGLGLALCNDLIKKSNGSICFDSELNKGTTITVSIPLCNHHSN